MTTKARKTTAPAAKPAEAEPVTEDKTPDEAPTDEATGPRTDTDAERDRHHRRHPDADHTRAHPHPRLRAVWWRMAVLRNHPAHAVTCPRRFPVLIRGRTYYVTCDQPHGHDGPCTGRATDWGAPTL